ncbi:hypothetical protein [Paracraurococcus lichenis]|uniref:Uncharacterized protein n=1 Tax=Paracraurococcus lichenis TaxID=3064888 RepID=A0ABT9DU26_9PROT|nr:hypothetical protein [Paracraurococcus sp. LOR1-02]MDO9707402.1 hypothetical protein [Paracraurococcus sp. LOR1-02]
MLAHEVLPEMAFTRAVAEQKIRGREETINEHLVKLLAFDVPPELRESWKRELVRKHFALLAAMRLKPNGRPIPERDFLAWLYADAFEGNEQGYTRALLGLHDYARNGLDIAAIARRVADFHGALAPRLAAGEDGADLIAAL